MDRLTIKTYGCKVNTYDTGLLQQKLVDPNLRKQNVHILNTCAVTEEATKEAIKDIRRIKSKDPLATVVVTGCAAQVDSDKFEPLPGADLIVANSHKGEIGQIMDRFFKGELKERVFRSNIFRKDDLESGGGLEDGHTRSFLKIQDGCNSFCTYCVIPFARGKSRSISVPALVERVNELYERGVREVVLTGVHIRDYEDESTAESRSLEDLVEALLDFTPMPRFRISSLEPRELTDRLLSFYQNPRMCPHFHMSIQSANSKVLSEMRRKYNADDVEMILSKIQHHVSNAFVGMDIIVGFPGETEEEFQETYDRLTRSFWSRIHVFPYSKRPGTKASQRFDEWPRTVVMRRADQLRNLSRTRWAQQAQKQMGTVKSLLILKSQSKNSNALSHDYWPTQVDTVPGDVIVNARVSGCFQTQAGDWVLKAERC